MNPRPQSEDEILAAALERSNPADRAAYLDAVIPGKTVLRRRIEGLIQAHENAELGGFLNDAPGQTLLAEAEVIPILEKAGDRIGRYRLLEQIGEGGCGVVYVAEQEVPVRRRVALKVIKLGMDTRSVIARFEAERQALALMDHPNIARVLDGGSTDAGRPFFVMELVRGLRITDYCDQRNLSTDQRLKLFIQVCHAIQHAHQKGIIHRDIKPSNILVTHNDGVPIPKVIDFGIAKATTDQRLTDKTVYTALSQFIGTPAYMSPEQAEMSSVDIDTRSDIYALGVLLYELLTGNTPFDARHLLSKGLDEIRRIIREEEPPCPSTRFNTLTVAEQTAVAARRHADAPKLIHLMRGDLDWIVMKTLDKDRGRRYDTANGLAMDIQRHLNNEPVQARSPSPTYRLQKWARRNKLVFAAGCAVAAALLLGFGVSTWLFFREKAAHQKAAAAEKDQLVSRQRAERERNEARLQTEIATREKTRADEQTKVVLDTVHQLQVQKAAGLLRADNASAALGLLAQVLRENPGNRLAAARLVSALMERNFPLPRIIPLRGIVRSRFSPDGTRLAVVDEASRLSILESRSGQKIADPVSLPADLIEIEFRPDGAELLTRCSNQVLIWDPATLKRLRDPFQFKTVPNCVRFTQDGPRALAWDNTGVSMFDALDGRRLLGPLAPPFPGNGVVTSADLSSDGRLLAVISRDSEVQFWNIQDATPRTQVLKLGGAGSSWKFGPDSTSFVMGSHGSSEARMVKLSGEKPEIITFQNGHYVLAVDFSPDGTKVAFACGDSTIRIWDTSGNLLNDKIHSEAPVRSLEFDGRSRLLLTYSDNNTLRLWDAQAGIPASEPLHFEKRPHHAELSPTGSSLLVQLEKEAQLWDIRPGYQLAELTEDLVEGKHVSGDGRFEVELLGQYNGAPTYARILDHRSGKALSDRLYFGANIYEVKFSPDNNCVAIGFGFVNKRGPGGVAVIDPRTGTTLFEVARGDKAVRSVAFSPDGERLATCTRYGFVRVWNARTGSAMTEALDPRAPIEDVAFSSGGDLLLGARDSSTAVLWNAKTGAKLFEWTHSGNIHAARFSPNGKQVITAGEDRSARLWDTTTGKLIHDFRHETGVLSVDFNPDAALLATGSKDGLCRVWDVLTGQLVMEPLRVPRSGEEPPLPSVEFRDAGNRIAALLDGHRYTWSVPDLAGPAPAWLPDLAEAVAGQRIVSLTETEIVLPEKLLEIRRQVLSMPNAQSDPYVRVAQWFFEDRMERNVSPSSTISTRLAVRRYAQRKSLGEFETAQQLASDDPELARKVLAAAQRHTRLAESARLMLAGRRYSSQNETEKADKILRQALALREENVQGPDRILALLHLFVGNLAENQNNLAEAEKHFRAALIDPKASPFPGMILGMLGDVLVKENRLAEAEEVYREQFRILSLDRLRDEAGPKVISQIVRLLREQKKEAGIDTFAQEVIDTGNLYLMGDAAWQLATSQEEKGRAGAAAVRLAEKAVEITARKETGNLQILAAAYAEAGEFEKAIAIQNEAVELCPNPPEKERALAGLKLLQSHQPIRDQK